MPTGIYKRTKIVSKGTREKMSKAKIGNKNVNGTKRSKYTREKISKSKKGKVSWNKGIRMAEKTKIKISSALKGSKSPLWKGGMKRYIHTTNTREYRRWRSAVFQRDNWVCQTCGARSEAGKPIYLEAHHIKSWAKYEKLRFNIDNGITLCKDCHKLTRKKIK